MRILLCFILLSTTLSMDAQEYNHIQFTTQNGLPSNTVYDVAQDSEGFIWVATDAGVARFDGRNFVTYTTNDGLPSNEVLVLYPDKKGRMWITALHNSISYHYKGKIHSYKNDTLLKRMQFGAIPHLMMENKAGDVMIGCGDPRGRNMYIFKDNNELKAANHPNTTSSSVGIQSGKEPHEFIASYFDTVKKFIALYVHTGEKWEHRVSVSFKSGTDTLRFYTQNGDSIQFQHAEKVFISNSHFVRYDLASGKLFNTEKPPAHDRISNTTHDGKRLFSFASSNGTFIVDSSTGNIITHLLPGKITNRSYMDREGIIWVCTNSEGLFAFPSRVVKSLSIRNKESDLLCLYKSGNILYAGSPGGDLLRISNNKIDRINFDRYIRISNNQTANNLLRWIEPIDKTNVALGFDDFILKYDLHNGKVRHSRVDVVKQITRLGTDSLLVATGRGTLLLNNSLSIIDTILPNRSYCAIKLGNDFYIGAPNGPVKIKPGEQPVYLASNNPELNIQVNHMAVDGNGAIWMSTMGNGIFKIRNDRVEEWLNTSNGLNSNNCKAMFLDEKFLWVGTEKGLNRINRHRLSEPFQQYTIEDGLASNDIHSVLSDSGIIYLATDGKLTWFDSSRIKTPSICKLHLLNIELGKNSVSADILNNLRHNENNLKFYYTALSFKSSTNIVYLYRLRGISDSWDSTFNSNLEFLALSPGEYLFEIFARNKFGQNSNTISIPFIIKRPFWETWWFRILILSITIATGWWIVVRRIRREQEKSVVQNRLNELEQQALRSQMNPHFIFNCLNSIQNFLLQNNFEKTNEYLTSFAHLIRQTLDNSSRSSISLEVEIRYLNSYLELESMRFAHSFVHSIELDPDIDADHTFIPTMILQPYVENSIRHGLRYKQEGVKSVKIIFRKKGNTLVCIVEDNGVGRRKAAELKSFIHVEYQSKGMTLTAERIAALNRRQDIPITVDVIDMEDDGNATGTQVIVRFPNVFL